MTSKNISSSRWTTASLSDPADTSPMELSALGEHLNHCRTAHRRLFAVRCAADVVNGFVSARFVTSVLVLAILIGAGALIL
jgi:hypothetical protein